MQKLKKILFPFFSVFLIYRTAELVRVLRFHTHEDYTNAENIFIAFLLNLFVTGVFAFLGFVYPTHRLLPDRYYRIHHASTLNLIYQFMKVDIFKKALLFFYWGKKENRKKYFNGTKGGIHSFVYETKQSEFGHLGAFLVLLFLAVYLGVSGYLVMTAVILLINIIGNLYPVILQRFHRMRLSKWAL